MNIIDRYLHIRQTRSLIAFTSLLSLGAILVLSRQIAGAPSAVVYLGILFFAVAGVFFPPSPRVRSPIEVLIARRGVSASDPRWKHVAMVMSPADATHAWRWFGEHFDEVADLLVNGQIVSVPETAILSQPPKWNGAHWRWFLNEKPRTATGQPAPR